MSKKAPLRPIQVAWQAALIGGILLGLGMVGVQYFAEWLANAFPNSYLKIRIALLLFLTWLVVSSVVRSIHRTRTSVPFGLLLLGAILTAVIGTLLFQIALAILFKVAIFSDWSIFAAAGVVGLLTGLLTAINLKVKNRMLGNLLEIAVVGVLIALFFLTL